MRFKILKFKNHKKETPQNLRVIKFHSEKIVNQHKNREFKRFSINKTSLPQFIILLSLIIIIVCSFLFIYVNREKYVLKSFDISGLSLIKKEELDNSLSSFINQNIFIVFPSQIETYIESKFDLAKEVKAEKVLPDKITVKITEKQLSVLIVNPNSYEIWDSDNTLVRKINITPKIELDETSLKVLGGKYNLEEIPLTPEQALKKNKILVLTNEAERLKQLEKFEKDMLGYRISEFRKLQDSSYKEALTRLNDKIPQINTFKLPYFFIEQDDQKLNKQITINNFLKLQTGLTKPSELVFISSFGNISLLQNGKIIRLEGSQNIDNQIKALNTLQKSLEDSNTNYFQITITGEKVAVL